MGGMGPPHSVNRCRTPAPASVRATRCPPDTSLIAPSSAPGRSTDAGARPSRGEARDHLRRDGLELVGLLGGVGDGVHQEVAAAGRAEALELLGALGPRADDPVPLSRPAQVLCGAPAP